MTLSPEMEAVFASFGDYDGTSFAEACLQDDGRRGRSNGKANGAVSTFTAAELQHMIFPPMKFVLPELVPEGATLVVSRPKLGKSWMVLDIALAVAAARFTLGELKPVSGDVLYLALEDGRRRLQRRITKLLPTFGEQWPNRLTFATEWPRADQGGLEQIEKWITSASAPRLIIIDTLAQFRERTTGKDVYADDYAAIAALQKLASKHNVGIIIVHHDRKMDADDVFDTVSGSFGLTGAADTILILKRQASGVTMHIRGRDIEEAEKAISFSKDTCRWTILGEAAEVHRSDERSVILTVLKDANEPMSPRDIMVAAELTNRNALDLLLYKMAKSGEVEKTGRGLYLYPGKIYAPERSAERSAERLGEGQSFPPSTPPERSERSERLEGQPIDTGSQNESSQSFPPSTTAERLKDAEGLWSHYLQPGISKSFHLSDLSGGEEDPDNPPFLQRT